MAYMAKKELRKGVIGGSRRGQRKEREVPSLVLFFVILLVGIPVLTMIVMPAEKEVAPSARSIRIQNEEPDHVLQKPETVTVSHEIDQMPAMYGGKGAGPIIIGEERCVAFRESRPWRRRPAVAGLFNTGTNLLWKLLRLNCAFVKDCAESARGTNGFDSENRVIRDMSRYGHTSSQCAPFLLQVPWGKHNPVLWRTVHLAQYYQGINIDDVLPIVVLKDPLTWFQSMCRMEYAASFRHGQAQCCPSPIARTKTLVRFRKEHHSVPYDSIAHFWSKWNYDYYKLKTPRLMIRYEDLLWRAEATISRICNCSGGTMLPKFRHVTKSAKSGVAHGFADTTFNAATAKYGNETRRYQHITDADLHFLKMSLDPFLVNTFHYNATTHRRRALIPSPPDCVPNRIEYLKQFHLKPGVGGGPVPLDDESDGVVANGNFYPNPNKIKQQ